MDDVIDSPNGAPSFDVTGDVDLALIDYCLSLTPAQRLRNGQAFANWILEVRRRNGIEGAARSAPKCSTGSNCSEGWPKDDQVQFVVTQPLQDHQ